MQSTDTNITDPDITAMSST